jgi:hypothetical protein
MNAYYGLPQNIWDNLLLRAEDLLSEHSKGQVLIGMYPAGGRIYGLESESHGMLGIYFPTPEDILSPLKSPSMFEFSCNFVGHTNSPILLVSLLDWLRWLGEGCQGPWRSVFLHAIPCMYDIFHEDDSLTQITRLAAEYLQAIINNLIHEDDMIIWNNLCPSKYLYLRTLLILVATNKFIPCINPEWGETKSLDSIPALTSIVGTSLDKLVELDNVIIPDKLGNTQKCKKELVEGCNIINTALTACHNRRNKFTNEAISNTREKLSDAAMQLLRFQM